MTSARETGAGAAVTGLFLGSLAIAGAVALVTAPITPRMAVAQTVADPQYQPATASLVRTIRTVEGGVSVAGAPAPSPARLLSDD